MQAEQKSQPISYSATTWFSVYWSRVQNAGAPRGASRNVPKCSKSENESDLIRECIRVEEAGNQKLFPEEKCLTGPTAYWPLKPYSNEERKKKKKFCLNETGEPVS